MASAAHGRHACVRLVLGGASGFLQLPEGGLRGGRNGGRVLRMPDEVDLPPAIKGPQIHRENKHLVLDVAVGASAVWRQAVRTESGNLLAADLLAGGLFDNGQADTRWRRDGPPIFVAEAAHARTPGLLDTNQPVQSGIVGGLKRFGGRVSRQARDAIIVGGLRGVRRRARDGSGHGAGPRSMVVLHEGNRDEHVRGETAGRLRSVRARGRRACVSRRNGV